MMPIFNSAEDLIKFQKDISEKFNQYKRMIQLGETTLLDLEGDIVSRNAALGPVQEFDLENDSLDECVNKWQEQEDLDQEVIKRKDQAMVFLNMILGKTDDTLLKQPEEGEEEDDGITK